MPTSEQNRDLLQWAVVLLSLVLVVALGVGYVSMTNRTTMARLEHVLNGDGKHPGALARIEDAATDAQVAANRADHTLTSVIAEARAAATSPATLAAARLARERIEKIELAVCGGPCPDLPTTTTTTIGPPSPEG